ncbi:MAG: tRNA pseudouridine(38-40) synthase TruA [Syntrophales bacterium]|nr:tRNA pseudouridine(38-40) synthase TruA [Syntrophales bacterium]
MHKYKITLEYDGTGYRGWQAQKNAKSVQETLIKAAAQLTGSGVDVQGAGRTDAGVHALAQVAHLETKKKMEPRKLMEGLNDILPSGINIIRVERASPRFHARHNAQSRSYVYLISKHRTAFGKRYVWWIRDRLDCKVMAEAGQLFSGFHDFASFADKRSGKETSTLVQIDLVELLETDGLIVFRIAGSHFLWKMVRRVVGVLVEVGRGTLSYQDVEGMLHNPSDIPAQVTASPSGLFLEQVLYEGDTLQSAGSLPVLPVPGLWKPTPEPGENRRRCVRQSRK